MVQKKQTIQVPIPISIPDSSSVPKMAYTPEETAEALSLGITYTRALIKDGSIRSVLIGKTKRIIPITAIQEFLDRTSRSPMVPEPHVADAPRKAAS
jgi:excisionase family DNA binding protein